MFFNKSKLKEEFNSKINELVKQTVSLKQQFQTTTANFQNGYDLIQRKLEVVFLDNQGLQEINNELAHRVISLEKQILEYEVTLNNFKTRIGQTIEYMTHELSKTTETQTILVGEVSNIKQNTTPVGKWYTADTIATLFMKEFKSVTGTDIDLPFSTIKARVHSSATKLGLKTEGNFRQLDFQNNRKPINEYHERTVKPILDSLATLCSNSKSSC